MPDTTMHCRWCGNEIAVTYQRLRPEPDTGLGERVEVTDVQECDGCPTTAVMIERRLLDVSDWRD